MASNSAVDMARRLAALDRIAREQHGTPEGINAAARAVALRARMPERSVLACYFDRARDTPKYRANIARWSPPGIGLWLHRMQPSPELLRVIDMLVARVNAANAHIPATERRGVTMSVSEAFRKVEVRGSAFTFGSINHPEEIWFRDQIERFETMVKRGHAEVDAAAARVVLGEKSDELWDDLLREQDPQSATDTAPNVLDPRQWPDI